MPVQDILKMYYGMDIAIENPGYFYYQNQLYYIYEVNDIQGFLEVYRYYRYLMYQCHCEGYHIVKNSNQDIISSRYILFMYSQGEFDFSVYLEASLQPSLPQRMNICDIKEQWIYKIDCVKEKVKEYAYSFKHDQDVISLIYYYCGIAENSINILNEILNINKQASIAISLSLSKPIQNYIYELLNPTYYVFSTREKHIICLLESHLIQYSTIQELLESHYFDVYEIIYLFARTLYPSQFFEYILYHKVENEVIQNYYCHLQEEKNMYKEIMNILSFYVTLPKISWINGENMV
ncbi:MAG: hypothetical protein RR512_07245 [Coprobacillus sp.]